MGKGLLVLFLFVCISSIQAQLKQSYSCDFCKNGDCSVLNAREKYGTGNFQFTTNPSQCLRFTVEKNEPTNCGNHCRGRAEIGTIATSQNPEGLSTKVDIFVSLPAKSASGSPNNPRVIAQWIEYPGGSPRPKYRYNPTALLMVDRGGDPITMLPVIKLLIYDNPRTEPDDGASTVTYELKSTFPRDQILTGKPLHITIESTFSTSRGFHKLTVNGISNSWSGRTLPTGYTPLAFRVGTYAAHEGAHHSLVYHHSVEVVQTGSKGSVEVVQTGPKGSRNTAQKPTAIPPPVLTTPTPPRPTTGKGCSLQYLSQFSNINWVELSTATGITSVSVICKNGRFPCKLEIGKWRCPASGCAVPNSASTNLGVCQIIKPARAVTGQDNVFSLASGEQGLTPAGIAIICVGVVVAIAMFVNFVVMHRKN